MHLPAMRRCSLVGLGAMLFLLLVPARGQSPHQPVADEEGINQLRREILAAQQKQLENVLSTLDKAAGTPRAAEEFFYDCVRNYDFKRDLDVSSKFDDWKRSFVEQWRGHDLGFVLQLQLRHQALALRSTHTKDPASLISQWISLIETVVSHVEESMFGASILAQPVNASVFDKALKLRQLAGGMQGFGGGPLDIGGIFDQHIHPHVKPENRQGAWEKRISLQSEFAEKTFLPTEWEDFQNFELPRLRWRQLMDVQFPSTDSIDASALSHALDFVRRNAKHPDAKDWIEIVDALRKRQSLPQQ